MDKLVSTIDIIFKLVLALVAVYVGYQFNSFKQQNDDAKLLVELAFSTNDRTALAGTVLATAYMKAGRISPELYGAIVVSAGTASDTQLGQIASNGAQTLAGNRLVAKRVNEALSTLPIRVYFHISREADRQRAKQIEDIMESQSVSLAAQTLKVPGIQFVNRPQPQTEVRCFSSKECNDVGSKIVAFLANNNVPAVLSDLSASYGNSDIRPNHFEVWFAKIS
ncbi:hypothetical protein ACU8V1_23505 [Rhizobium leguminosarum]